MFAKLAPTAALSALLMALVPTVALTTGAPAFAQHSDQNAAQTEDEPVRNIDEWDLPRNKLAIEGSTPSPTSPRAGRSPGRATNPSRTPTRA